MRLLYYPGCSLTGTAREYHHSILEMARLLDIELVELADWNCCGASSAHMTDYELSIRLSARNLQLARRQGLDLLVPCAACFQRLRCADRALRDDPRRFGMAEYLPGLRIVHLTALLAQPEILQRVRGLTVRSLSGLGLACYYGCLSLRPPAVTEVSHYEDPQGLDLLMEALGANPLRWSHQTECCSGSLTMARPDISRALVGDILTAARRAGAQALVTDCPMCQANLESRQIGLAGEKGGNSVLPVFFGTELLVLALTGESDQKQWRKHLLDPRAVLGQLG